MINWLKKYIKNKGISIRGTLWLFNLMAPYKWKLLGLILIRCVLTAIGIWMAIIHKLIVDRAAMSLSFRHLIVLAVCCTGVSMAGVMTLNIASVRLTEKYSYYIRNYLYERILNGQWLPRSEFHSEELLSRLTSDIQAITRGTISVTVSISSTILQFLMAFLVLWNLDRSLAVFAAVTGPVIALFSFLIGRKIKKIQEELQQSEADYRIFLQEQINNADTIKIFEQEKNSLKKLDILQQKRLLWIEKKNKYSVCLHSSIGLFFSGSYLIAFVSGALKIADGSITYGTMTAFLSLVGQIQRPVSSMSRIFSQAVGVLASAGRVLEIADMPQEKEKNTNVSQLSSSAVGVRIENMCFSYDQRKNVLSHFSMDAKPGNFTLIMGPSGAGKTTIIRTLLGFLVPDSGKAWIYDDDGHKILCSQDTRKYISYVPQGNTLFTGTIADNLRAGKADATDEQMQKALEIASAWEFVRHLPDGLNTEIGEQAHGLSGGQAQRIAIARAIIRPSALLILDEATSALDEATEKDILDRISKERGTKTCLVISHRNSMRQYADQVIWLEPLEARKWRKSNDSISKPNYTDYTQCAEKEFRI